jgi:hypothetical protein
MGEPTIPETAGSYVTACSSKSMTTHWPCSHVASKVLLPSWTTHATQVAFLPDTRRPLHCRPQLRHHASKCRFHRRGSVGGMTWLTSTLNSLAHAPCPVPRRHNTRETWPMTVFVSQRHVDMGRLGQALASGRRHYPVATTSMYRKGAQLGRAHANAVFCTA